jgi:hypothetical protein
MDSLVQLDSVSLWLQGYGLSEYEEAFRFAGFDDINSIKCISESDLDKMDITKPGTRKKILFYAEQLRLLDPMPEPITKKPKGNSRANPYRCTKCCEFKIRSLDGKAHQCKPELVGHSWEECPTQNLRQHPEERQRRKMASNRAPRKRLRNPTENENEYDEVAQLAHGWESFTQDNMVEVIPFQFANFPTAKFAKFLDADTIHKGHILAGGIILPTGDHNDELAAGEF